MRLRMGKLQPVWRSGTVCLRDGSTVFLMHVRKLFRKLVLFTDEVITFPEVYMRNICKRNSPRGAAEGALQHSA